MENNDNTTNLSSSLCTANCGFFGNPKFDGMCSQCYKEALKKKNANPESTNTSESPRGSSPSNAMASALEAAGFDRNTLSAAIADFGSRVATPDTTPSVETALPTIITPSAAGEPKPEAAQFENEPAVESKQKKRNRCVECRKKVGLTGFECRCGGLYCSHHRYSDKHNCQFDYKKDAEEEIRKNNPVVIGQKIQKL